jgi:hypothetical protein
VTGEIIRALHDGGEYEVSNVQVTFATALTIDSQEVMINIFIKKIL